MHLALYGNVGLKRAYCASCAGHALVVDNKLQCCDALITTAPTRVKRISEPEFRRVRLSNSEKEATLAKQRHCCFYCGQRFGSLHSRGRKRVTLKTVWDHIIPFVFSQNNTASNYVAACQVCNGIKSDRCYQSLDEAKSDLASRRKTKGYDF